MLETAKIKLVTIVIPYESAAHLGKDLHALGARGYTTTSVDGHGAHGARQHGILDGANVRFEVLAHAELARRVLEHVAATFAEAAYVAYVQDVEAIPREHFS